MVIATQDLHMQTLLLSQGVKNTKEKFPKLGALDVVTKTCKLIQT